MHLLYQSINMYSFKVIGIYIDMEDYELLRKQTQLDRLVLFRRGPTSTDYNVRPFVRPYVQFLHRGSIDPLDSNINQ